MSRECRGCGRAVSRYHYFIENTDDSKHSLVKRKKKDFEKEIDVPRDFFGESTKGSVNPEDKSIWL